MENDYAANSNILETFVVTHLDVSLSTAAYLGSISVLKKYFTSTIRVKSGIFGQTAKFGQPPCLIHSSIIGIKNK